MSDTPTTRKCAYCGQDNDKWQLVRGAYFCEGADCRDFFFRASPKPHGKLVVYEEVVEGVDFADVMDRMMRREAALNARVESAAAKMPQTVLCQKHEIARRIDFRESALRTRAAVGEASVIVYEDCRGCVRDAKLRRDSEWLRRLGVPEILSHASLDGFVSRNEGDQANLEAARQFAAKRRGFLLLLGDVGCGKSFLAAALLREFGKGWFVSQAELISGLRRTYRDTRAQDVKERAKETKLLVLDDVGISAAGSDVFPALHEVLEHRHGERSRPTVLTSNLDLAGIKELVGPRISDRLSESAFKVLNFAGQSMRAEKKGEYFE